MTFSRSVIDGNSARFWNVRAIPTSAMACASQAEEVLAVEDDTALSGLVQPADHVEARRLAGTVRPDEPADVALPDAEGELVEGDHPTEADRDLAHVEQRVRLGGDCRSRLGHYGSSVWPS